MSCIALSVGLGNVWRFPFTALDNGGGAFVIPYIIVLFLVGKPVYYLEMLLGQFSSRGSVKVYDFSPIMRGKFWSHIHLSLGFIARPIISRCGLWPGLGHRYCHHLLCHSDGFNIKIFHRFLLSPFALELLSRWVGRYLHRFET